MRKLLVTFSLILALFGSSVIVNAAVQKGTVNISSTLDGTVLIDGSDSQIDIGSVMDLDATEVGNGNEFAFWIVNGFVRTDLPAVTQLRVQSKMNLVAVFRSADKHAVLFVDSNGKLIADVYVADEETATAPSTTGLTKPGGLTVVADEANRWISLEGNTSLAGINSSRVYVLQYEMPATSFDIMAIGAVVETFTANKNDVVTVVAADTANFKYWADGAGNVLSYNSTYSFTVLEEVIIEAESETVRAAESFVVMQDLTGIRSDHVSYMGRYELHGGDELVEFGFIYGKTIGDIEMGMPNVAVAISNVANPATNEFLMSFVNGHHVTARAYAIVRNGEAIRTIYSDLVVKPSVQEIEDIRGLAANTNVNSYGIVSGIMGTKYVFVQQKDGSAGIVLYNATIPTALAVGDEVIIRGTMGEFRGLVQITSGTFEILNSGNTVPLAEDTVTLLSSLTTADQGRRFSIDGLTVVSVSGQDLKVKDSANNEITIRVDQTSYTDLMDFVASLVPGEVINLVDMHLIWYDGAQFSFNSLSEIAKTDNGQLVWDEDNINYSIIASDFYAGLHPADLSVVQIDGKNALQVKYEEGFFDLSGTVKTTPGIQFANGNKFKLTQDSVVTFSVRVSEEWSVSHNRAGIYLFYDGEACGIINATGNFWSGSTSPKVKNDVFIEKVKTSVMQIFANATIGDKNWVNVAITFNGIENPDLSKLSIAYGVAQGTDYNGLLNTVDGHENSWIYISDLTVLGPNEITWNDATMNYYLTSNDLYAGLYPADLSVVEIDGRNALKVKYQEGFFDLTETNKTTPGITFTNTDNLQLTQSSVVTFSVRVSDEWNYSNNGGGIYIFYNGEVCGTISTSGTLWSGATATGERDRYINKSLVSTMNIFANGTIGDKQWVDVTITFEGIENPDLGNLTIAYGGMHGSNFSGLLSTESQENSWIYISDVVVS